jgi:hypothetical protein
MTQAVQSAGYFAEGDFRIGRVLGRAASVFSRNFLTYFVVTGIAGLPPLLVGIFVPTSPATVANPFQSIGVRTSIFVLTIVLGLLSQAIVLHGAFQDMRGRTVRLADCVKAGLRRFVPLVGLAIYIFVAMVVYFLLFVLAIGLLIKVSPMSPPVILAAVFLFVIPLLAMYLMWFVVTPACVLERLGPLGSLGRSRGLTKGHRWRILGLILVTLVPALIVAGIIAGVMASLGTGVNLRIGVFLGGTNPGTLVSQIVSLIWTAIWTAFNAILVVVAYHDLRVAKEGVDTEQIAAVFE